jgi:short-subunit dehydrogenase
VELNRKVAWVIGASSGIGAAVARELASRGGTVAISARRDEQLREVAGGHMLVVPLDITDAASAAAAAVRIREELGPIDVAVLSAGYWQQMDPAAWDTEVFDQHVRVNLTGMSNSIAAVLPGMLRRRHGVIAGIASVAGYRGLAGAEAYGATKAAQINLLESLRVHVARTGVHVTTICPGFVRTDLTAANPFPMPFIIDADAAARSICDGLERERTEIVFPKRMALLMKTARLVPARAWTALWARTSLTPPAPAPSHSPSTSEPEGHHEAAEDRHRRQAAGPGIRLPLRLHHYHRLGPGHRDHREPARRRRRRHGLPQHLHVPRPADPADLHRA